MVRGSPGTRFTGSALVRLLGQLADAKAPAGAPAFAERLAQWLGWTDAISLSAALQGGPEAAPSARSADVPLDAPSAQAELARTRAALAHAIAQEFAPAPARPQRPGRGASVPPPPAPLPTDFTAWRRRYTSLQQAMDTAIGVLRSRLRDALSAAGPERARLAAVDAVMERVLGGQEHVLLAGVPAMLEKHFERLRDARPESPDEGLTAFSRDLQAVLLAELETRLQPAEGLLEALLGRHTTLA